MTQDWHRLIDDDGITCLPDDDTYVLAHVIGLISTSDAKNKECAEIRVLRFHKGITLEERNALSNDDSRKYTYRLGDETSTSRGPAFAWTEYGTDWVFGGDAVDYWIELPEFDTAWHSCEPSNLPEDNTIVLAHLDIENVRTDAKNKEGANCRVLCFHKGLTLEERSKLSDDNPRKNQYYNHDEHESSPASYAWRYGADWDWLLKGDEINCWIEIPELKTFIETWKLDITATRPKED